jgi:hypothetical protein
VAGAVDRLVDRRVADGRVRVAGALTDFDVEAWLVGAEAAPGSTVDGATGGGAPAPKVQASTLPACG